MPIEGYKTPRWQLVGLFLLGWLLLCCWYYQNSYHLYPYFHHSWMQTDRYALALGFYEKTLNLFVPRTYNLETQDGITAADLPLIEYLAGLFMRITDQPSPTTGRLWLLAWCLLGYGAVFGWLYAQTKQFLAAFWGFLFVFSLPIVSYYQCGFSPSLAAYSVWSFGLVYYLHFLQKERSRSWYISIFGMILAALIRKPFLLPLLGIFGYQFIRNCYQKQPFKPHFWAAAGLFICIFGGFSWHNSLLAQQYGSRFLNELMPSANWLDFKSLTLHIFSKWVWIYGSIWHYISILGLLLGLFWSYSNRDPFNRRLIIHFWLFLGLGIGYFVLMHRQFDAHEYYFLDSFAPAGLLLLLLGLYNLKNLPHSYQKRLLNPLFILTGIGLAYAGKQHLNMRYQPQADNIHFVVYQNYQDADKFIAQHLPKSAKLLIIDAYTTNSPLIQCRRDGFCNLTTSEQQLKTDMQRYQYDHIIVQNNLYQREVLDNYPQFAELVDTVASNGRITILKPRPIPKE